MLLAPNFKDFDCLSGAVVSKTARADMIGSYPEVARLESAVFPPQSFPKTKTKRAGTLTFSTDNAFSF